MAMTSCREQDDATLAMCKARLTNNRSLIAVNLLICLRTREVGTYERCRVSMYVCGSISMEEIHKIICEMSGNERSAASLKRGVPVSLFSYLIPMLMPTIK